MSYIPRIGPATGSTQGLVKLAGDLGGSADAPTVTKVQGISVSATAPTSAQVLTYNGTNAAWAAAPTASAATVANTGLIQLAGDLSGSATSPTVAKIRGVNVSSTAPVTNQFLSYDGTNAVWKAAPTASDATTTSTGLVQLAGDLAGPATAPTVPALANKVNTSAVGAANGIASLGATGKLPFTQLPALVNVVSNPASGYNAKDGDYILASASSAELIINLPTPVKGAQICVKKVDNSTNSVTIKATVAIDDKAGTVGFSLPTQWWSQDFLSDGTQWYCI